MPRLSSLVVLAALGFGGWYFLTHYEVEGVDSLSIKPRSGESEAVETGLPVPEQPPVPQGQKTIRIATVNLAPLDDQKLAKPHVVGRLVQVIRQFDVVAIQGVRARNQSILLGFVDQINAEGRHYDFAAPSSAGGNDLEQFSAFLFDRATVQIDRSTVCLVEDQANLFRRDPLVAAFLARGPSARQAFTFTLVNVCADAARAASELDLLDDVFRAVRDDGRGEDDVILLGTLGADDRRLGELGHLANVTCAISDVPSTTRGTRLVDNLVFDGRATGEFTGRSGVVDLIRQFELSMREAVEISDHLPVWAEFSVYEGGQAGHVAAEPVPAPR